MPEKHRTEVVPSVPHPSEVRCKTYRGLCSCLAYSEALLTREDAEYWGKQHKAQ